MQSRRLLCLSVDPGDDIADQGVPFQETPQRETQKSSMYSDGVRLGVYEFYGSRLHEYKGGEV